jgi:hypothetical protein
MKERLREQAVRVSKLRSFNRCFFCFSPNPQQFFELQLTLTSSISDKRAFTNPADMLNNVDGSFDLNGSVEARRWSYGREDDSNYHHVQENQAQNGGICVPEGLHSLKQR